MSEGNKLSFLDSEDVPEAEAVTTTTEEVSPEAPTVARDEQGRFAAKEVQGEASAQEVETGAPPAPETEKQPSAIPISALLDERDKRQKAEARLQEYERLLAQQRQPAPQIPDPIEDAQGYTAYIQGEVQRTALNDRLNMSEEMAREKFGVEEVEAAKAWALSDPRIAQFATAQAHPYKALVEEFRKQKAVAEIGTDPEAYKARIRQEAETAMRERIKAELMAELQTQAAAAAPRPAAPPPSMASTTAMSAQEPPFNDVQAFKAAFGR